MAVCAHKILNSRLYLCFTAVTAQDHTLTDTNCNACRDACRVIICLGIPHQRKRA